MKINEEMNALVQPLIDSFSGRVSIAIRGVNQDFLYQYHAKEQMSTASIIKLFVLGTLLELCNQKRCSLDQKLVIRKTDFSEGSGILKSLRPGTELTVYDVAMLMIIVSDNTATNLLIDYVGGVEIVNEHLSRHGIYHSRINRKLSEDPAVMAKSNLGDATAEDFADYLWKLRKGGILCETNQKIFWDMMSRQLYKDMFPGNMPVLDYPAEPGSRGVAVANKTGFMTGIRCDTGWIKFENGKEFTYAVMINDCKDLRDCTRNEANLLITDIGSALYELALR